MNHMGRVILIRVSNTKFIRTDSVYSANVNTEQYKYENKLFSVDTFQDVAKYVMSVYCDFMV